MLQKIVRRIENLDALDPIGEAVGSAVTDTVGHGPLKSALSGGWMGHQLHPALTDLPIGFFTSAVALDVLGGRDSRRAAVTLTVLGLLSSAPTAAAGLSDWADTYGAEKRVGTAHAAGNGIASLMFAASLVAGRRGRALRMAGMAASVAAAYLGGHLSLRRGVGVDHNAFAEHPSEWTAVDLDGELDDGRPTRGRAGSTDLVVYQMDGVVYALADRCGHAGGPLHEGDVDGEICITCPWHGSRFSLTDGRVLAGPASVPQPVFDARRQGERLEVRLRSGV